MMAGRFSNCGLQPSSRLIFSEAAINRGGSPGRRGFSITWNFFAGNFAADIDHFAHTRAATGAEVVKSTFFRAEGEDVGAGEVEDMNVIADAGAIRCLIVGTVNLDLHSSLGVGP